MLLIRAASRRVPGTRLTDLPTPDRFSPPITDCHNPNGVNGVATHQDRLSHTLPTSDPDLAFIMETWDRLAGEIKARLIEIVRANLPTDESGSGVDREFRPTQ